ncbi:diacylglycerol kinase [Thalassomonas viridans]|uniref:Diacylglycerol kinase n=1 Tax=Thalassomonas viridans TaxID=137584 RepID=A0AAE9Z505_9GAMM|nr:diacylglycerol kinase [Thalassomonas viridans]WDE06159.1 diacylglycerol kinase [Thalassomonas viridans]
MNYQQKPKGLKRIYLAAGHSARAFNWLLKNETAFKQEILGAAVLVAISLWLELALVERLMLWLSILFVIFAEVVNTGIEAAIDRIGPEHHPLSGLAKDLGSLAVTISLIIAAAVWLAVLAS